MNHLNRHIMVIVLGLSFGACANEVEQEDLIEKAVEIKLEQYRSNQFRTCKENAYVDAEDYVDSLMVAISLERKLDTIPKPKRPVKPEMPVFKTKPDSIIVDRIYN